MLDIFRNIDMFGLYMIVDVVVMGWASTKVYISQSLVVEFSFVERMS